MFIGHFAAGFAAKKINSKPSLGTYFLAAQFLDLLWPTLLLLGVEKAAISTDPANPIPLSFTDYPVSHSLLAVLGWGLLIGFGYFLFSKNKKGAVVVGLLVISHWFLDLLVHIPDLPLYPGGVKTGFGLWHQPWLVLALELVAFGGGVFLYYKTTITKNKTGRYALMGLIAFLLIVHIGNAFGPPPESISAVAWVGELQWLFVIWAYWVDRNRMNRTEPALQPSKNINRTHFIVAEKGKAEI